MADESPTAQAQPASNRLMLVIGSSIVAFSLLCFFFLYYNNAVSYRGGNGLFIGWSWMINHGYLPYRDFFCHTPVLYLLRGCALLTLFDGQFISFRYAGMLERMVMGVLIFLILSKLFPKKVAVMPALVTMMAGSCDHSDCLCVYTTECIFYSIVCIACGVSAMKQNISRSKLILLAMLSGVAAGCCLFTKQSVGLGCAVAAPVVVSLGLWRLDGIKKAVEFVGAYLVGLIASSGAVLGWMAYNGILNDFLVQCFVTAPAAKATNAGDFFARFYSRTMESVACFGAALLILAFSWKKIIRLGEQPTDQSESARDMMPLAAIAAVALTTGTLLGAYWTAASTISVLLGLLVRTTSMFLTFYGLVFLCSVYLVKVIRGTINRWEIQAFIFASIAFADTFMVGLSFPFYEQIIPPGLAIVLAMLAYNLKGWKAFAYSTFCFVVISTSAINKIHYPFLFEDFIESPASQATKTLKAKHMKGFSLPADMADFIDETVEIVAQNTTPNDKIFAYPEGGIFYPLTERHCTTFCMGHNMDTVADSVAEKDAQKLLDDPPKVLIYYRTNENWMKKLEKLWRRGKPSGNRALMNACEELGKRYKLAKKFPFPNACEDGGVVVEVYVRPD